MENTEVKWTGKHETNVFFFVFPLFNFVTYSQFWFFVWVQVRKDYLVKSEKVHVYIYIYIRVYTYIYIHVYIYLTLSHPTYLVRKIGKYEVTQKGVLYIGMYWCHVNCLRSLNCTYVIRLDVKYKVKTVKRVITRNLVQKEEGVNRYIIVIVAYQKVTDYHVKEINKTTS